MAGLLASINEGAKLLEEGIALRASDIDMVYITGYGSEYAFTTPAQLKRDRAEQRRLRRAAAKKH